MTYNRNIPYGRDPDTFELADDEQDVLIRLLLWWRAGHSFNLIARSLNAAGFRTRGGGAWAAAGVSSLWRRGRRPAARLDGWTTVEKSDLLFAFNINEVPNWCRSFVQSNESFRNRYASDTAFRNDCAAAQYDKGKQRRLRAAAGV